MKRSIFGEVSNRAAMENAPKWAVTI